jgi:hypothetical protein
MRLGHEARRFQPQPTEVLHPGVDDELLEQAAADTATASQRGHVHALDLGGDGIHRFEGAYANGVVAEVRDQQTAARPEQVGQLGAERRLELGDDRFMVAQIDTVVGHHLRGGPAEELAKQRPDDLLRGRS